MKEEGKQGCEGGGGMGREMEEGLTTIGGYLVGLLTSNMFTAPFRSISQNCLAS